MEGTFSQLAQKVWVEQHLDLMKLCGKRLFYENPNPMMRRSYGAIYLKDMSYQEFCAEIEPMRRLLDEKTKLKKHDSL